MILLIYATYGTEETFQQSNSGAQHMILSTAFVAKPDTVCTISLDHKTTESSALETPEYCELLYKSVPSLSSTGIRLTDPCLYTRLGWL